MRVIRLEETTSTNDEIGKFLCGGEDVAVIAKRQTAGKGTKGRSFLSDEGGLYVSVLTFYKDLPASRAFEVMLHAAVSVSRTAARFGVSPEIKWPNDVLAGGRKLCGILIENTLSGGNVRASVVGMGLNVSNDLSSLEGVATSLYEQTGKRYPVAAVADVLLEEYARPATFEEYLSYIRFLGRPILVVEGDVSYPATAKRVLPDGRLEAETASGAAILSAAEISVRLLEP